MFDGTKTWAESSDIFDRQLWGADPVGSLSLRFILTWDLDVYCKSLIVGVHSNSP